MVGMLLAQEQSLLTKDIENVANTVNTLVQAANDLVKQETIMAIQTHEMVKAWDKVTTAIYDELTVI